MGRSAILGLTAILGVCATSAAQATLVGGPVPMATLGSFGGSTAYTYVGASVPAFATAGGGTLQLTIALYGDAFGTSQIDQSSQTVIFSNTSNTAGATATIAPAYSPFLFFFKSLGTDQSATCNPATGADCATTLFSNGATAGAAGGNDGGQADLAIYYAASTNTYAMFFDDGGYFGLTGGVPNDDNDFNDLVVTFTPTSVPEPVSLGLLGVGLAGIGLIRRRKQAA